MTVSCCHHHILVLSKPYLLSEVAWVRRIFPQTFSFVRGSINQLESVFCVDILTTLEGTRKASFITKKMASERWIFNIFKADFPFLCDHARPSRIHNEK